MKKLGAFLIPIVMFLLLSVLGSRMLTSGTVDITTFGILAIALVLVLLFSRSRKNTTKSTEIVKAELLDAFASDAFSGEEALKQKFDAALADFGKNMPKASLAKLEKLAPLCTGEKEKYAVALATAKVQFRLQKFANAILAYNQALVLHPSGEISVAVGDCYQRLGELEQARDSYEFAIDLDAKIQMPAAVWLPPMWLTGIMILRWNMRNRFWSWMKTTLPPWQPLPSATVCWEIT